MTFKKVFFPGNQSLNSEARQAIVLIFSNLPPSFQISNLEIVLSLKNHLNLPPIHQKEHQQQPQQMEERCSMSLTYMKERQEIGPLAASDTKGQALKPDVEAKPTSDFLTRFSSFSQNTQSQSVGLWLLVKEALDKNRLDLGSGL